MAYEFKFPDVGEGITEGEIVKWHVKEGDIIKQDQTIVEIETDKAIVNIPSPKSGKILKINFKEGDTIKVGETLVEIEAKGEKIKEKKSTSVVGQIEEAKGESVFERVKKDVKAEEGKVLATPAVRALAKSLHIKLDKIKGTGLMGRITEEDVKAHVSEKPKLEKKEIKITKKYDLYGYIDRIPLKGVRKSIAKNLTKSAFTAVHVTHMDEADVTHLVSIREKEKIKLEKKGIHLTYLPFMIKAVVAAFKKYPNFNSTLDEEIEEIIVKKYYNIGIAVDTKGGLIVPVIKGADQKDITKIAKEIETLAKSAKDRTLNMGDLKGGTFTITNIGVLGGKYSTPIINYPEAAILATGRIYKKPVVKDNEIKIRYVLPLSLTFDHRIVDGADAARFVNELKSYLEDPDSLLL